MQFFFDIFILIDNNTKINFYSTLYSDIEAINLDVKTAEKSME